MLEISPHWYLIVPAISDWGTHFSVIVQSCCKCQVQSQSSWWTWQFSNKEIISNSEQSQQEVLFLSSFFHTIPSLLQTGIGCKCSKCMFKKKVSFLGPNISFEYQVDVHNHIFTHFRITFWNPTYYMRGYWFQQHAPALALWIDTPSYIGHQKTCGIFPHINQECMLLTPMSQQYKPWIGTPVHGIYLGQVATKCSSSSHLDPTNWFHTWCDLC